MFGLSPWELLLIFLAILLMFGAKRLPEIGSSLGRGIREFKGSIKEVESNVRTEIPSDTSAQSQPQSQSQEPARPRASNSEA